MLPDIFFSAPQNASTTTTKKELQNILLRYGDGGVLSCGKTWNVKFKHLGVGIYRVWLVERVY